MPGEWRSSTIGGQRALQRQQRAVGARRQRRDALQLFRDIGEVAFLGAGIDHQIERRLAGQAREHEIVLDGARIVQQQAVALHASFRPTTSAGVTRSSAFARIGAGEKRLAHMRDIEQARLVAGVQMFFQHAGGILHRHLIAGERHHLAAQLEMQGMQRRAAQDFVRVGHKWSVYRGYDGATQSGANRPLSWDLRDFPASADWPGLPLRWGRRIFTRPAFQKFISCAVLLPESFRGGCSFGLRLRLRPTSRPTQRTSPARDHVLARRRASPADGHVAVHHKGRGQRESTKAAKSHYSHSFGNFDAQKAQNSGQNVQSQAQRPSRAARKASSVSDRMWCSA